GLGGSSYLKVTRNLKTGTPPRCNLERERDLHTTLRSLIYSGGIKSAHDCSEGGLAVAIAESCISRHLGRETPALIRAVSDLADFSSRRVDALLFGETQGRIVVSTSLLDAVKVLERAQLMGIPARR